MRIANKGRTKPKKRKIIGLGKFRSSIPNLSSNKPLPDRDLDFSDIPEATDEQLRRARRVGRPVTGNAKHLIAIRIAPRVLDKLRRLAAKESKPYQTYIHEILERAVGGLGKFSSGLSDLGSNKKHMRSFGK
jgi:predicted DNA binding CopG/RHH family protein